MTSDRAVSTSRVERAFGTVLSAIALVGAPVAFFAAGSIYPIDTAAAEANYSTRTVTVVEKEDVGFRSTEDEFTFDDGTTARDAFACEYGVEVGDEVTVSTLAPYGSDPGISTLGDCGAETLVSHVEGAFATDYRDPLYMVVRLSALGLGGFGLVLALRTANLPDPSRTEVG